MSEEPHCIPSIEGLTDAVHDGLGDIIAGIPAEASKDLVVRYAHGGRIPQGKRRYTVSVDIFRRFDELCKGQDGIPCLLIDIGEHLQQDAPVTLDDQWFIRRMHVNCVGSHILPQKARADFPLYLPFIGE